ncbi:hypothetical protein QLL95_gp1046 [Cotonvirus japonicus]|uniref:Uncharacterized protein n=1 Tax=Cotonvirus japonicus TaxID=2811091 RepID=A0ABM7NSL0_9VIRU|nr:hypothetical protein QLL95_gp1046 [Cotonvirus japonicus]BCS83077.1 hypothetical protein [Cotonvirus japonicus]
MDKQYHQNINNYNNVNNQIENITDLTQSHNDSIKIFAEHVFNQKLSLIDNQKTGIILDDTMTVEDTFCMILELTLHGLNILGKGLYNIFDLENTSDNICEIIFKYLKSCGIIINLVEHENINLVEHENINPTEHENINPTEHENINSVADLFPKYYCKIIPKPLISCFSGWYVNDYQILYNTNNDSPKNKLSDLKAIFMTKKNKLFSIQFDYFLNY